MEHEKSRILTNILRDLYFRNDTIYSHMLWKENRNLYSNSRMVPLTMTLS